MTSDEPVIYQIEVLKRLDVPEKPPPPRETSSWADNRLSVPEEEVGQRRQIGQFGDTGIPFEIEHNPYLPATPWGEKQPWRAVDPFGELPEPCRDAFEQGEDDRWLGLTTCPARLNVDSLPSKKDDEERHNLLLKGAASFSFVTKGSLIKTCQECPYAS